MEGSTRAGLLGGVRSPFAAGRRASGAAAAAAPAPSVLNLDWRPILAFLRRQPASFWFICTYLFFEYVRPQTIYPAIAFLPWAFYSIVLCAISFLVEGGVFRKLTFADTVLAAFSGIVLLSSLVAVYPSESFDALNVYFSWVLIYWLITNVVNTRERFVVFMLAYMVYCLKMSQHGVRSWAEAGFMFRTWGTTCAPGWFNNSGECGIQMVIYFSTSLAFVLGLRAYWGRIKTFFFWFMPASAAVTIMGSSSRGGVFGLAAVALLLMARSRKRVKAFLYVAAMAITIFLTLPQGFKERFTTMGEDGNSQLRIQYWKDGIKIGNDYPVLGIGYNNWLKFYLRNYDPAGQLPHNIFVQAFAELGYVGLAGFVALIVANFVMNARTRRIARQRGGDKLLHHMAIGFDGALLGYMVSGFFVTVLYYPFFWINFAMSAALHNVALVEDQERLTASLAARWRPAAAAPAAALPTGRALPAGPAGGGSPATPGEVPPGSWPAGGPGVSPAPGGGLPARTLAPRLVPPLLAPDRP